MANPFQWKSGSSRIPAVDNRRTASLSEAMSNDTETFVVDSVEGENQISVTVSYFTSLDLLHISIIAQEVLYDTVARSKFEAIIHLLICCLPFIILS